MALPANQLEIIKGQRRVDVGDVLWCEMDLVVYNLPRSDQTLAVTDLTQTPAAFLVRFPRGLPRRRIIKRLRKWFHIVVGPSAPSTFPPLYAALAPPRRQNGTPLNNHKNRQQNNAMRKGETHELEMTERKGRNEHESESVALLLPVGIEIKKRTEALTASALYPLYILPHGNTLVLCILLLLEHHLHLDQTELAKPHDIVITVVHIDRDLLPRFHVEVVGNQGEALVAVRQSG